MDQITELTRVHIFLSHVHDGPLFMIILPTLLLCLIIINSLVISLLKLCELRVVTHGANVSDVTLHLFFLLFISMDCFNKMIIRKITICNHIYIYIKNFLVIIMELKHEHEFSLKCFS